MSNDGLDAVGPEPYDGSFVIDLTRWEEVGANGPPPSSWGGMATTIGPPLGAARTRALLEEIAGGRRGAQIRAQVAATNRGATQEQVEEAFQEACLKASRGCHGQSIGEVYVWLRSTTTTTLRDMRDRVKREVLVDEPPVDAPSLDPALGPADEVLIRVEEQAEIDELSVAILERLPERERHIAVLHSHGLARNEIAGRMGVTPRIVKRSVEEILATGRQQLTRLVGYGCADGHDLVSRHAFGLGSTAEARRAQLHLTKCDRCGSMFERLDHWRERVAALVPIPPAVEVHGDAIERVVHAGTDAVSAGPPAGGQAAGSRGHLSEAIGQAREYGTSAYYRVIDPTPLAGIRPGAVAAAVAGCIAVGGGATYCVEQNTDPLAVLSALGRTEQRAEKPKAKKRPERARVAQVATTPTASVTPTTTPQATPTPAPQQATPTPSPSATRAASLPPAPEDEFEPSSPVSAASAAPTASSTSNTPAPAPADGPGEFDGP